MDEHAEPIKNRVIKNSQVHFMNGNLRRAINVKIYNGEHFTNIEHLLTGNCIVKIVIKFSIYAKHVPKLTSS
jgi:hypothetical protein